MRFWQSLKDLSHWDFAKVSWDLDGKHVVLGEVIEGFKTLHKMKAVIISKFKFYIKALVFLIKIKLLKLENKISR